MIKACIFDMDGTVLNTITTITYYVNQTLQKFGFSEITEEECKYFVGDGAKQLIERALKSKGVVDDDMTDKLLFAYSAAYNESPLYLTEPYNGIIELVSNLRARGIKLAILSNKPDFATRSISSHFFGDSMDMVFGARESVALKPSPDALFDLMSLLSVTPEQTLYIGDTSVDMQTGKRAGVKATIGVLWGFRKADELLLHGADILVSEPHEILREVKRLE